MFTVTMTINMQTINLNIHRCLYAEASCTSNDERLGTPRVCCVCTAIGSIEMAKAAAENRAIDRRTGHHCLIISRSVVQADYVGS